MLKEHELKNPCYPNRKPRQQKPKNASKRSARERRLERRRLGPGYPDGR